MSFYLYSPTGNVSFHKLEEYALKRLQFLLRLVVCQDENEIEDVLQDADIVDQSDCLITGTAKDAISHYALRLTLGGLPETSSFFFESELSLFRLRVQKMFEDEWTQLFSSLDRSLQGHKVMISTCHKTPEEEIGCLLKALKQKFCNWAQLAKEMCSDKSKVFVQLPFQMLLKLVANRQVSIHKGMAEVPVPLIKAVLAELYEKVLQRAVRQAATARAAAVRDERIHRLASRLLHAYRSEMKPASDHSKKYPPLRLADLWTNCSMFPPCMENLMTELRVRHRLRHHDRVQLTLFLKELGLPVHEALLLWKREYSTPVANGSSSCHHGWHGNERRYIYNIRHLYGLEGGRVNYKAHSCSAIQGRSLGCVSAGGCPFMSSQETSGASNGDYGGVVYDQAVTRTKCQKYLQEKLLAYKQAITPCCGDVSCKKIPHFSSSEIKHNNGQCLADKRLSTFGHNFRTTCHRNIKPKLEINTDISSVAGYCGDASLKKQTLPNVLLPEVLMSNTVVEPVLAKEICFTNMKYSCKNLSGTLKRHLSLEHSDISYTSVKQPRVTKQKLSSNVIDPEIPSNKSSVSKKTLYQMDDVKLKLNTLKTEKVMESSETICNKSLPKMELSCEEVRNVNKTPQTQGSDKMCCCTVDIKQTSHLKKPSDFYFQCLTLTCN